MAQEWVMIATPLIAGGLALAGVALSSFLSRRGSREAAKRADRLALISALEDRYLTIQTTLELFIRSPARGGELNKELAILNAVVTLFAEKPVIEAFKLFSAKFRAYQDAYEGSDIAYASIADASVDFSNEWNAAMSSMYKVSDAMRSHLADLRTQLG
ncbi:hypothetical protein V2K79_12435 [Pseudomonas alliivorans]|nr:hypothetical protein [Pseudomonas alliivorans]